MQCLRFVPSLDGYVSASQKGAIVIWNSSVSIPDMVLFLVTYKLFPNWKIADAQFDVDSFYFQLRMQSCIDINVSMNDTVK